MDILLWSSLTPAERKPINQKFASLNIAQLDALSLVDLALLVQWMLAHDKVVTKSATERAGGIDLELDNATKTQVECARVFGLQPPVNSVYDAFEHAQSKGAKRLYIFSVGDFSDWQRQTQEEYKLFLDLIDGKIWAARLRAMQLADAQFFAERKQVTKKKR
jgi:hypothetical protein